MTWDFKSWYKRHGKGLNSKRRGRYAKEDEYRDRVLQQNRESRHRKQVETSKEKVKERQAQKVRVSRVWREVDYAVDEKHPSLRLVTVGALARVLNRSKVGIRVLEKQGVIPATPYRSKKGERLYSPEQIVAIRDQLAKQGRLIVERKRTCTVLLAQVQLSDGTKIETPLVKIGDLAKAVGRATVTLEQMERKGLIPRTSLRLPPSRRAYTPTQVEAVKEAFDKWGPTIRDLASKRALYDSIFKRWSDEKLIGAVILSTTSGGEP